MVDTVKRNHFSITYSFLHFLPAWLAGFIVASVSHSCAVLIALAKMDIAISFDDYLFMITQDALGLLPTYGAIIAFSLILAFFITHAVTRALIRNLHDTSPLMAKRVYLLVFSASGAIAFLAMLMAMNPILNVTLIAGARTHSGLLAQCSAGLIAGYVYGALSYK